MKKSNNSTNFFGAICMYSKSIEFPKIFMNSLIFIPNLFLPKMGMADSNCPFPAYRAEKLRQTASKIRFQNIYKHRLWCFSEGLAGIHHLKNDMSLYVPIISNCFVKIEYSLNHLESEQMVKSNKLGLLIYPSFDYS